MNESLINFVDARKAQGELELGGIDTEIEIGEEALAADGANSKTREIWEKRIASAREQQAAVQDSMARLATIDDKPKPLR